MSSAAAKVERIATLAAITSAVMIATQVAGKATRDAVFLSVFDVSLLPAMVAGSAVLSIFTAIYASRWMTRLGPGRLLPATFAGSAVLFAVEAALQQVAPGATAIMVYLHMGTFGGILVSGFWSLVNERFDPHTAKKKMGRIAGGATFGGLLGGLTAERVAATIGSDWMFPVLALLHATCAVLVWSLRDRTAEAQSDADRATEVSQNGFQVLAAMPYLRNLALLLVITTVVAGLIDFVFKAAASAEFANDKSEMLRFFAAFYTAAGALTFLAQTVIAKQALERLGLARTVSSLPTAVVATGLAALALPGLIALTIVRGLEEVVRNSLFRSGYELLYTPVPRRDKRATKLIIDVGLDRAGDAAGAGLVAAVLAMTGEPTLILVALAIVLAVIAIAVALRLHRGYVRALESSLVKQAEALDLDDIRDSTTRLTMLETTGAADLHEALIKMRETARLAAEAGAAPGGAPAPAAQPISDRVVQRIADLRSGEAPMVELALRRGPVDALMAPHAIALLAWDDVQEVASKSLIRVAPRVTGALLDALLDPDEAFAIRRRVARVLGAGDPDRAPAGLMAALSDRRFEVRFHAGRSLARLARKHELTFDRAQIYAVVQRELEVSPTVWQGHRLLDESIEAGSELVDDLLAPVVNRGLEHVFALLALVLPRKPVRIAFRGLHTDDPLLRGTALEYLDSALPENLRAAILKVMAIEPGPARPSGDSSDIADRLMQSMASIEVNLEHLIKAADAAKPSDPSDA